jgi:hypothetical protein
MAEYGVNGTSLAAGPTGEAYIPSLEPKDEIDKHK